MSIKTHRNTCSTIWSAVVLLLAAMLGSCGNQDLHPPTTNTAKPDTALSPQSTTMQDTSSQQSESRTGEPHGSASAAKALISLAVEEPDSMQEAKERLEAYIEMVEKLEKKLIQPGKDDLDTIIENNDYEAEKIVLFVKNNIRDENYSGVLRGAAGTLKGRAGNSADQSLLLAALLKDAGYDARIVKAELSAEIGAGLFLPETRPASDEPPALTPDAILDELDAYAERLGIDRDSFAAARKVLDASPDVAQTAEAVRSGAISDALLAALRNKDLSLRGDAQPQSFDYYWVQYRKSATAGWQDAHLLPLPEPVADNLQPENIHADTLPDSALHRVGIQVIIEQEVNGNRREVALGKPWIRPAANLDDRNFDFQVQPMSVLSTVGESTFDAAPVPDADVFVALFGGQLLENAFDSSGNVVPLDAAGSAYAGVFATASDKLNQAAGLLGQLGQGDSDEKGQRRRAMELAGVKLVFSFISPGGKIEKYQRIVYDKSLVDAPEGGNALSQRGLDMLTREFSIQYSTTRMTESEYMRLGLSTAKSMAEQIIADLDGKHFPEASAQLSKQTALYHAFDTPSFTHSTYRHAPNLIVHSRNSALAQGSVEAIDIVHNARRSRTEEGAPEKLLRQGVWESLTEGSVLDGYKGVGEVDSRFTVIRNLDELQAIRPRFDEVGFRNARTDIERNAVLAFEQKLIDTDSTAPIDSWWRIASNGQTLRMLGDGTGGETSEYMTQQQIAQSMTCVLAVTSACRALTTWAGPTAVVRYMSKSSDAVDFLLNTVNSLSDAMNGPSIPFPPEGGFDGTGYAAEGAFEAARHAAYKRCLAKRMKTCAKP